MKRFATGLVLVTLTASPALAHSSHYRDIVGPLVTPTYRHHHWLGPAGTTWHDNARYGQPPRPTGTYARSQNWKHYVPVDSYDVVLNGTIVGRDPDPNIRFQLLREAGLPPP